MSPSPFFLFPIPGSFSGVWIISIFYHKKQQKLNMEKKIMRKYEVKNIELCWSIRLNILQEIMILYLLKEIVLLAMSCGYS